MTIPPYREQHGSPCIRAWRGSRPRTSTTIRASCAATFFRPTTKSSASNTASRRCVFLLIGFWLMMLMRWQIAHPGQPVPFLGPLLEKMLGPTMAGNGVDFAGALQFLRRDARDDHGVSRRRAAGVRGVRQLRCAADDWRAGHGVPAHQHGELSGVFSRRPGHAGELLHSGRRGAGGLDLVFAAGHDDSDARTGVLARRHGAAHHVVAAGRGEFHRHHHSTARAGHDLDAAAVVRLGAIRDGLHFVAGVSAARSRGRDAIDGQRRGHQLFPADGTGGGRQAGAHQRRRQPVAVAALVLVPRPPGGLCPDFSGDGHGLRNHRQQHAQADLGLQIARVSRHWPSGSSRSSSGRTTCI